MKKNIIAFLMVTFLPSAVLSNPLVLTEAVAELYMANDNFNVADAGELNSFLLIYANKSCIQTPELVRDKYSSKKPTHLSDDDLYTLAKEKKFDEVMVYLEAKRYIALGGRDDAVCQKLIRGNYKTLNEITEDKIKKAER